MSSSPRATPSGSKRRATRSPRPRRSASLAVASDVATAAGVDAIVTAAEKEFGGADILINNAGSGSNETIMEAPDEKWQAYWDLHVMAAVRLTRGLVPSMRRRGGGVILNNASICAVAAALVRADLQRHQGGAGDALQDDGDGIHQGQYPGQRHQPRLRADAGLDQDRQAADRRLAAATGRAISTISPRRTRRSPASPRPRRSPTSSSSYARRGRAIRSDRPISSMAGCSRPSRTGGSGIGLVQAADPVRPLVMQAMKPSRRYPSSTDVARLAGVSQSAVSRAFSEGKSISEETRQKVFEAAKKLDYSPNFIPRILLNHRSHLVAVVSAAPAIPSTQTPSKPSPRRCRTTATRCSSSISTAIIRSTGRYRSWRAIASMPLSARCRSCRRRRRGPSPRSRYRPSPSTRRSRTAGSPRYARTTSAAPAPSPTCSSRAAHDPSPSLPARKAALPATNA